jgi:DNA replication and repair protein RecF
VSAPDTAPRMPPETDANAPSTWVRQLTLTNFRNYASATIDCGAHPVILTGHNGAGKTNILEAVSLLAPGQGLRRAAYADMRRAGHEADGWALSAQLVSGPDDVRIGTGLAPTPETAAPSRPTGSRLVRIDGAPQKSSTALADYVEMVWLTPALDSLFTGAASDRRRFVDRLTLCLAPAHARNSSQFERAMRQRNKLLDIGTRSDAEFEGLEDIMATTGAAIAAARVATIDAVARTIAARHAETGDGPFPWAEIAIEGTIEDLLQRGEADATTAPTIYRYRLAENRYRDRAAGRTLEGPHRSDLVVTHGPKQMRARLCSTGEQKALLVGLVLAHAEMLGQRSDGGAPILLLDEVAAHLDVHRRTALFEILLRLGTQAWMTGTDAAVFAPLSGNATHYAVDAASVAKIAI